MDRPTGHRLALGLAVLLAVTIAVPSQAQTERQRRRAATPQPAPPPSGRIGDPLPGLSTDDMTRFAFGKGEFEAIESVAEGLGPVFNGRSCASCHSAPATGGGSARLVTRFGRRTQSGFDPLVSLGGSLIQSQAITAADGSLHDFRPERVPAEANVVARRRTTPLFGLGFVDATPDSVFVALAADQASRGDGTAGRVSLVDNLLTGTKTVGKFGWKAQVPSLFQFSGDAYLNEMGITTPWFPDENCPSGDCGELAFNPVPSLNDDGEGVVAFADYMTMLAPPGRGPAGAKEADGEGVFNRIGCAACHTATLQTGNDPRPALANRTYHPWSDFLLHDMGSLGDGIDQGDARGREMRTAPLWGLRFVTAYLHDGRATTLDAAILAHDGQARGSRDRYARLDPAARDQLIAFLRSL